MQPTVADRNNNPGNLRDPQTGSFQTFSTPQEGYAALLNDLQGKITGNTRTGLNPNSTLYDFAKAYAPSSDSNNPAQYTANLANTLGVRPDTTLGQLQPHIGDFAQAIAKNEGYTAAKGFQASLPVDTGGVIPTAEASTGTPQPQADQPWSVSGFVGNVASSAGNIIGGLANAVMHPVKTAETALGTVAGAGEKAMGLQNQDTQMFDNAVGYLKQRYGGSSIGEVLNHIGNTIYTDPVGVALDLSTVLDGVGAAVSAAGKISDVAKVAELTKASDYLSTVNGLVKSSSPEGIALLKQPGTLTKIGKAISTVSDTINPIVGGTNITSSVVNKVADWVPRRILLSAAPQLKRSGTVEQALDHVTFGSIDKNIAVSSTLKQGYYKDIVSSLEKSPIQVGPDFSGYLLNEIKGKYENLGKTDPQILQILKRNAGNEAGLVDKLANGTLDTVDAYRLKVALENNSFKLAIDNPSVKANKELAAFTGGTIGDYLKEIAPDTVPLFDEYSKEIAWNSALKHIKNSVTNKGILSMRDLVAFGAGHLTGVGGPLGLVAEKVLTSKTVQMNAAKAANITRKGVKLGTGVARKVAPTASKAINATMAGTFQSPTQAQPQ